jgi:hypothetical protein
MPLSVDHATIAGARLEPLQEAFTGLGLPPTYGGAHSNGITHMALLAFSDGSYIELISTLQAGRISPWWHAHIAGDGGPCAWAVRSDDVAAEAARVTALGIPVRGPFPMHRVRPDGTRLEWQLAYLGDGEPGAVLPFIIQDRSPRDWRVPASALVAEDTLDGVAIVVLGVHDLNRATEVFRRVYGWPAPDTLEDAHFGARLAHFAGTPVMLATPLSNDSWLAERLARFGESPCAFLLGAPDFERVCRRFGLTSSTAWFGRRMAWFDVVGLPGMRLGVI